MRVFVVYIMVLLSLGFYGQRKPLGSWYMFNGFYRLSPKTELFVETQLRTWEVVSDPQNMLLKPYLSYFLKENWQIGFSQEYHYSWTYAEDKDMRTNFEEYRIGLQSIYNHSILKNIGVQHRLRYEFRFLDEKGQQRARYRLQFSVPFNNQEKIQGYFFSTVGNEFMLNFLPQIEIDQNRLYGLIGYQISKATNFQLGYMHISHPGENDLSRIMFFLTHKLKTYKEK